MLQQIMLFLKVAIGLLVLFGGFVALMYVKQRALMYFPEAIRTPPAAAGLPQAEEIELGTADGETVVVWHLPPRGERPVVLYFHGNGGALHYRAERFRALTAAGNGLVALSYRGYSGSTGSPTEQGLLLDAAAAYEFATARYPAARIVLWGESLGGGVAIALATERPVARIVLEAPFSSAVDVGARAYWYLPVRALMKDQFRSDLRIGKVNAPVLILHGERDAVVPIAFAQRLLSLANEPKRLVRFPQAGHNDLDAHRAQAVALPFVATGQLPP